jgi:DTW domain-containing protein YfiP
MSSADPKSGPTRRRRRSRDGGRHLDLEALRASIGPRLRSNRARGVAAHATGDGTPVERSFCYRCHKAAVVCLCDRIRVVSNRTGVLIFQHPRERFHALGTARIANLGLERCRVLEARDGSGGVARSFEPPPRTGVLYPDNGSIRLACARPAELPEHLVVLDGTWAHAHALYRDNAWLRALPHFELEPEASSRYRLRQQPEAHCLSTIESIVCALRILEPETEGLMHLLDVFDSMIDDQIRYML